MFKKAICLVFLITFDVAALFSALFLAYLIRKDILLYIYPVFKMSTFPFSTYLVNYPYFIGLWVIILAYERLYTKRFAMGEEVKRLWKGEMSLVGPRPYLLRELEKMGGYRKTILKALPGMAGLWQVSGKNELTFEDRLRLEECS